MKKLIVLSIALFLAMPTWAQSPKSAENLIFNKDQVLFLADSYGGQIFAYPLKEAAQKEPVSYNVRSLDSKLADALGTSRDKISIKDLAVNPISKNAYVAVHKTVGKKVYPLVVKVSPNGKVSNFDLSKNAHTSYAVNDAPKTDLVFWKEQSLRSMTFTDMDYHNGKLYVAGTSNADFDASLRVINYPFRKGKQNTTTLEVYHAVHNQMETRSPIQTLDIVNLAGEDYVLAVYTCTPLVLFPLEDVNRGGHLKGKTIAELGYGNTPLDIKSFSAQDAQGNVNEVSLIINKSRGPMLINKTELEASAKKDGLSTPAGFNAAGTPFWQPAIGGVYQLEDLDAAHLLTLRRNVENGETEMMSYMKGFYFRLTDHVSDYIYPDYQYTEAGEMWRPVQNMLKIDEGYPETVVNK